MLKSIFKFKLSHSAKGHKNIELLKTITKEYAFNTVLS